MAVTAKQVYDMALVLMDEVLETGNIVADQPKYYEAKALSILTTLQAELLPLSTTPVIITDLSQNLLLPDRVSILVLPYGLAAHLLIQDDPNSASFFNARYDELKRKVQTSITPITDVYSMFGGVQ
jgi:hypothetical protein